MKVKPPKDYTFRQKIWELVDQCCEEGQVPACRPPTYALPSKRETVGKVRPPKCRGNTIVNLHQRWPWWRGT